MTDQEPPTLHFGLVLDRDNRPQFVEDTIPRRLGNRTIYSPPDDCGNLVEVRPYPDDYLATSLSFFAADALARLLGESLIGEGSEAATAPGLLERYVGVLSRVVFAVAERADAIRGGAPQQASEE